MLPPACLVLADQLCAREWGTAALERPSPQRRNLPWPKLCAFRLQSPVEQDPGNLRLWTSGHVLPCVRNLISALAPWLPATEAGRAITTGLQEKCDRKGLFGTSCHWLRSLFCSVLLLPRCSSTMSGRRMVVRPMAADFIKLPEWRHSGSSTKVYEILAGDNVAQSCSSFQVEFVYRGSISDVV